MSGRVIYTSSWQLRSGPPRTRIIEADSVPDFGSQLDSWRRRGVSNFHLAALIDAASADIKVQDGDKAGADAEPSGTEISDRIMYSMHATETQGDDDGGGDGAYGPKTIAKRRAEGNYPGGPGKGGGGKGSGSGTVPKDDVAAELQPEAGGGGHGGVRPSKEAHAAAVKAVTTPPDLTRLQAAIEKQEGYYPGSRAYRNNNPGNIKALGPRGKALAAKYGASGVDDQHHIVFPSYEAGKAAHMEFLRTKHGQSIAQMGSYAEDPGWERNVARYGGFDINRPLDLDNSSDVGGGAGEDTLQEPITVDNTGGGTFEIAKGVRLDYSNKQLLHSMAISAAMRPKGYRTVVTSAGRDPSHSRRGSQHQHGRAIDVRIYDENGRELKNIGKPPGTREYAAYEAFASDTEAIAKQLYGQDVTWGGHFRQGVKLDLMHMQAGGPSYYEFSNKTKADAAKRVAAYLAGPGAGYKTTTEGASNWGPRGTGSGQPPSSGGYDGGGGGGGGSFGGGGATGSWGGGSSASKGLSGGSQSSSRGSGGGGGVSGQAKQINSYVASLSPKYREMALRQLRRMKK